MFFFISKDYLFATQNCCSESERTFDMSFFQLANNENLLNALHLYYMVGNYGVKYTTKSRVEWFAGYINGFHNGNNKNQRYNEMINNVPIRLLITNDSLLQRVKQILE